MVYIFKDFSFFLDYFHFSFVMRWGKKTSDPQFRWRWRHKARENYRTLHNQSINTVLVQDLLCQSSYNTHTHTHTIAKALVVAPTPPGKWVFSTVPWRERKSETHPCKQNVWQQSPEPRLPRRNPGTRSAQKAPRWAYAELWWARLLLHFTLIQPVSALEWIITNKLPQRSKVS